MFSHRLTDDAELRHSQEHYAEEAAAVVAENREHLSRWLPWTQSATAESIRAHIRKTLEQYVRNESLHAVILVRGRLAGAIGFHRVDWLNLASSMGYWLAPAHEGRGLMTRACSALLEHAFLTWQLNRVEIRCAPDNARSRAIPVRLGFREEGVCREGQRIGDAYTDLVVYSQLASEWCAARGVPLPVAQPPRADTGNFFIQVPPTA